MNPALPILIHHLTNPLSYQADPATAGPHPLHLAFGLSLIALLLAYLYFRRIRRQEQRLLIRRQYQRRWQRSQCLIP